MNPLRLGWLWLGLGMGMLIIILVLALLPVSEVDTPSLPDKVLHGLAFAFLMVWFGGVFETRRWPVLAAALLIYGGLMELLQATTAYREPELMDMLADVVGLVIGTGILLAGASVWCSRLETLILPRSFR